MQESKRGLFLLSLAVLIPGLLVLTAGSAEAFPQVDWAIQYNSPYPSADWVSDLVVDADGNAYFTGSVTPGSDRNWVTVKLDIQGNLLWEAHYDLPGSGQEDPTDLSVDAQGNVYVAGSTRDYQRRYMTTIKYSPDGNELWVAQYYGHAECTDNVAYGLVVDDGGNVYVTGFSCQGIGDFSYTTIKYDPEGTEIWVALYDGPNEYYHWDVATEIALDPWGNVIVTGRSNAATALVNTYDFATVKYDPDGNELWVARYDGPENGSDSPTDLAVDELGNVYVTGDTETTTERSSTIKYDTDGNTLWVARHPNLVEANALALGPAGSVYVAGTIIYENPTDYLAAVKYDSDGTQLWVAQYKPSDPSLDYGKDVAYDIVVDGTDHIYVTGYSREDGSLRYGCVTLKVDPDGNNLWVRQYNGPANNSESGRVVSLGPTGNPYVAGVVRVSSNPGSTTDIATIKYDPAGNELWATEYDGPPGVGVGGKAAWDTAASVVTDEDGNVYVCGVAQIPNENKNFLTLKYDTAGNELWSAGYDGTEHEADEAVSLHVDGLGNVYVAGSIEVGREDWDFATVKYDAEGNPLWVARYDGSTAGTDSRASDMTVDLHGNVYVTGTTQTPSTENDFTTIKYDPDGNTEWVATYDNYSDRVEGPVALVADEAGHVYLTGQNYLGDVTTIKYDADGNDLWVQGFGGISPCKPSALALDRFGNVHVTGSCSGDYVTLKYNSDGTLLWWSDYNGPGDGEDIARDLVVTDSGQVYVTGESHGDGTWADVATVKYSEDGFRLWVKRYNYFQHSWDGGISIAADNEGHIYVSGKSEGLNTGKDFVTIKYAHTGRRLWATRYDLTDQDIPVGLALGSENSIIVTGTVEGDIGRGDIFTIKYVDTDDLTSWGVASSAMPEVSGGSAANSAGLWLHLLWVFLPLLVTTIWLRRRRVR